MNIKDVSIPEVYLESQDFRFFIRWFAYCFDKIKYDTENIFDLYDPLRCPDWLLWMLADTMGFKYDDRLPTAFNRLVLMYFMSMIRNKGSKDGVTLAAEANLAQFHLIEEGKENDIMYNRLEDTSIPVNSVYVTPHTDKGYIDVVYFSKETPIDACIEYVRPLGMYLFQMAGVRFDARTKISVDARLTNTNDLGVSIGPTHVGHYRRDDYASLQRMQDEEKHTVTPRTRSEVYYRNSKAEQTTSPAINPGYNALYALQLCNNENIVKSLIGDEIFSLGYGPQDVSVRYPDNYLTPKYNDQPVYNLRYDKELDESITKTHDLYVIDDDRSPDILHPQPAPNPRMSKVGDAIALNDTNTEYTHVKDDGEIEHSDGHY